MISNKHHMLTLILQLLSSGTCLKHIEANTFRCFTDALNPNQIETATITHNPKVPCRCSIPWRWCISPLWTHRRLTPLWGC